MLIIIGISSPHHACMVSAVAWYLMQSTRGIRPHHIDDAKYCLAGYGDGFVQSLVNYGTTNNVVGSYM